MVTMVLELISLPESPLDAAAYFHADCVPGIRRDFQTMGQSPCHLLIVFEPADHTHRAWRLAAIQELAREIAPHRLNAVASSDDLATQAARAYLEDAPGVTGQYLPLDGVGAGAVILPADG